ncbi:ABC transporter permease [Mucilaginibacter jinjuensis]|uniref:ABC transporter permease n=1 Tax=Mucilaginibacter jinjuensis TaxID=1176721 RepID=A0ABY7T3B0_9SPHI|nr:ABC transporter permease [Mucilaginibacter jinjuensis]WCT10758.1 ABC transporter permease [Mucilaginibacter jinjuensis]
MIKNYFKIAFRNFRKHKLFTLINIVGLTIGISAALVIYLIVHFDFTFDKFHPDGDRIYRVVSNYGYNGESGYNAGVTTALPAAVKGEISGLAESAPIRLMYDPNVIIQNGEKAAAKFKKQSDVILADGRFFNVFAYKWLEGSAKSALASPFQVVLSAKQAKLYFPGLNYSQMIGKQVVYEDTIKTTVSGIVANFKENTDITFHDFISFSTIQRVKSLKDDVSENWGATSYASQFYVKLNNKVTAQNVQRQMNDLFKRRNPKVEQSTNNFHKFILQPLSDLHFNNDFAGYNTHIANKTTLYSLLLIALFLLVLGCINFINLTTAQASQRAKEIGIRKTMGSSRKQLIVQLLSETFIITLLAVILAISITPGILKLFADFIPKGVQANLLQVPVVAFLLILTIAVSLLSGFYPAIVLSAFKPVAVLKNQTNTATGKTRNAWLRKSLTVTQFVIAQFFIMATILVSKQIYYVMHKDLGFKKDAIIIVETPYKTMLTNKKQIFINKLAGMPQIATLSVGDQPPSSDNWNSYEAIYKDGKKEIKTSLQIKSGDANYLKVYHLKLLSGRNLRLGDSSKSILVNANYAKSIGFKNPGDATGTYINYNGSNTEIIGVLADFYQESLRGAIKPLGVIYPEMYHDRFIHIALKPETAGGNEWKTAIGSLQKAWRETYPEDDFEYHFFDEKIAKFYESEQHTSQLLSWATGLSIFISCLGLLGLAMYTTNLRTKEIGVRKVLGATVTQIVTLLSTELVWLVVLAFVLVTPVAWLVMHKWMQNFTYRTTISWWVFALSGAGMLLTALITLSFQTIKAAIANPARSLKSE